MEEEGGGVRGKEREGWKVRGGGEREGDRRTERKESSRHRLEQILNRYRSLKMMELKANLRAF